ncbi:hypothetical protein GGF50DRAFT_56387 [Schizophyllum commune]
MNRYHLPPTSEALNHRSPVRLPNLHGQTLRFASPRHLAEAVDVTPRGERKWWVDPSGEERRHHRGGQRTHRRSHHRTPQTLPQRTNPAYANPYAPPNPAPRPARAPMSAPAPAPAPPVIPAQAYMPYTPAPQPQPPVGIRPAPAPQTYFTNAAPVIPPIPAPTVAPAPPEAHATNKHGASPALLNDPEPYTRYYHPSGAPAPRAVPAPAAARPAPPTQNAHSQPSRSRRLSNAVKSLFQKGDCSRAPAPAAPPQVVYVAIPAAAATQPAAPRPTPSDRPVAADRRAEETVERPSSAFNIYTRDMLPRLYGAGRDCERDPHWQGTDKEKINVLMPVGLLDCWSILFNAQNLKEIHFWHITGNDSWRVFPAIRVRELESLYVHANDAWLTNLLNSLRVPRLRHLEVCYSAGGGGRFSYDKQAYVTLVGNARRRVDRGHVCISPNHPVYSDRHSSLKATLEAAVRQDAPRWKFHIRDERLMTRYD